MISPRFLCAPQGVTLLCVTNPPILNPWAGNDYVNLNGHFQSRMNLENSLLLGGKFYKDFSFSLWGETWPLLQASVENLSSVSLCGSVFEG